METMTAFLDTIGLFFQESVEWLGTVLTTITENPALTVVVFGMSIAGFAVGLLSRLIRL